MTVTPYLIDPPTIPGGARDAQVRRAMQACVDSIIDCLTDAGIPYCLLRNRDRIPGGLLGWTDLDLMIPDTVSFHEVLDLFSSLDPALVYPVRRGFTAMFFPVKDHFLRVDIFNGDIEWRGAAYGLNRDILAGRWDDDGIMVASVVHQAFLAWFSRLLQHGDMPDRYVSQVTSTAHAYPGVFRGLLTSTFGPDHATRLMRFAAGGVPHVAESVVPSLRRSLWIRALRQRPAHTLSSFARQLWNAVDHRLRPVGLSVAIVGPDHAANETLCKHIATLPARMVPYVIAEHMPRRGSLVDQWLAELIWTRQRLAHAKLVVRDHHPVADSLNNTKNRVGSRIFHGRFLERFAPGSDLIIILDASGEMAPTPHPAAPNEAGDTEVRRLAARLPGAVIVDGSQAPADILAEVLRIINNVTTSRTQTRFNRRATPLESQRPYLGSPRDCVVFPVRPESAWGGDHVDAGRH